MAQSKPTMLEKNSLVDLPPVIFGTSALGNLYEAPSDETKSNLVGAWFDAMPIPVIDCAGKYGAGLALEVLGHELAARNVSRHDVVISNKLGWRRVPMTGSEPTFEPGVWANLNHDAVQDISYHGIRRCWEQGCELLGDYAPQLLSVHDPDEYLGAASDSEDRKKRLGDIVSAYDALGELRDSGQATAIGIGCKDWRVIEELDRICSFDWVMFANSFTVMSHPTEFIELLESLTARRITVINSAVLHGGFLCGSEFRDYRRIDPQDPVDAQRLEWRKKFTDVCASHHVLPFEVAVAFGCSHPGIASVALNTNRPERVRSMVVAATQTLAPEIWQGLQDAGLIDSSSEILKHLV